ncbi:hypothetical protein A3Q56_04545 [Intoshia linei]|uniref:Uncharacterized protein n=1 Tax=Intoshia linei TaxID=1819745 RepID=A0A177B0C5_9BILA|nr:hypothetical protein A3Q56_04545 [Intoshia linei]
MYLASNSIKPEIMKTNRALSLFNMLNAENRNIGCALIPSIDHVLNEDDFYKAPQIVENPIIEDISLDRINHELKKMK